MNRSFKMPQDKIAVLPGVPLQVVKPTHDHRFELQESVLERILLQDHVKDKKVVVVSVAGAFRKGKSFLLNFFLRFLSRGGSDGWIGGNDEPLTGFKWRGLSDRETTGIWMWSHGFVCPGPNGEEVAVLLMDTQGAFDTESILRESTIVFALSVMLSSVLVYNLSMDIHENNLNDLELFIKYGQLAIKNDSGKPFQNLMFLIRDWSYPYENKYGLKGGQKQLDKRLKIKDTQHEEIRRVRKHIKDVFKEIQCFLMPQPGPIVASEAKFDGRLKDIPDEFRDEMQVLTHHLLSSKNLVIKEVNGNMLNGADLLEYFKAYTKIVQGDTLPELKTLLQANAEANHEFAVANALKYYVRQMENKCGEGKPYRSSTDIQYQHTLIEASAFEQFWDIRKMGGERFSERYFQILISKIKKKHDYFVKYNEAKTFRYKKAIIAGASLVGTAAGTAAGVGAGVLLGDPIAGGATGATAGAAAGAAVGVKVMKRLEYLIMKPSHYKND